jgi:predicted nucleic acid-binding protein
VKGYVLDASALMALFDDRPGAAKVEELLVQAADSKHPLLMSVINWGEVYYSIWRARGEAVANEKLRSIAQLPIEIVDADMELAKRAAMLKSQHNLPYADCFAAALAESRRAALVTSDKDFELVGSLVKILWV